MSYKNPNRTILAISVLAPILLTVFIPSRNIVAVIENNVSAKATTGGNKISGSGTIITGDATASAEATNYVNGNEKTEAKTEASAEVQGKDSEASVEVNGEKKTCKSSDEKGCLVEIKNTENSAKAEIDSNKTAAPAINISSEVTADVAQIKTNPLSNFIKNITNKILSWFS